MSDKNARVICAVCDSAEDDTKALITCSVCTKSFHPRCVNVNLRGFHKKKNWICNTAFCRETSDDSEDMELESDIFLDADDKVVDYKLFHYILKQKDELILELRGVIKLMKSHIELLHYKNPENPDKKVGKKPDNDIANSAEGEASRETAVMVDTIEHIKTRSDTTIKTNSKLPKTTLNDTKKDAKHHQTQKKISGSNKSKVGDTFGVTKTSNTPRPKNDTPNKKCVIGINSDSGALKSSPAKAYLYIRRLAKTTTADDLKTYLMNDFPEVICELLENKHEENHARFKVTINFENLEKINKPEYWPSGVLISRFFHPRKPPQHHK